ncbi:MAG: pitrilysin family protein [Acidobacteria bacterium]|nr:pitrilysin family protein [Acidobacteriota bacterium]
MIARADRSRMPEPGPVPPTRFPTVACRRLSNGLALRTVEHPGPPVVTFWLMMPVGSAADPAHAHGLAALTADLLDEGSVERSGRAFHEALDGIGARLGTEVGPDSTIISISTVVQHALEGLGLLAELVARPRFDPVDVGRVRDLRRSRVQQLRSESGAVADRVFIETLFAGHPYGHLGVGTDASLASLTAGDVVAFHRDAYHLGSATLIAVGALSHQQLGDAAEQTFGALPVLPADPGVITAPADLATVGPSATRLVLVDRPGAVQSELRIGHVAVARDNPDYHALQVLNVVLGGQFVSRLNQRLREEKGYTYGVRTGFDCRRAPGPFALHGSVQADATTESVQDVLTEMAAIGADRPVTAKELEMARAALTRGFARGFETAGQVARGVASLVLHGLPAEYYDRFVPAVEAVDAVAVTAAATAHLRADEAVVVIVGPAEALASELTGLGLGEPLQVEA